MTEVENTRMWYGALRRVRETGIGPRALAAEMGVSVWAVKERMRRFATHRYGYKWQPAEMAAWRRRGD